MRHAAAALADYTDLVVVGPNYSRRVFFSPVVTDRQEIGERVGPQQAPNPVKSGDFDGMGGHPKAALQLTLTSLSGNYKPPETQGFGQDRSKGVNDGRPGAGLPMGWAMGSGDPLFGMNPPRYGLRRNIRRPEPSSYGLTYMD